MFTAYMHFFILTHQTSPKENSWGRWILLERINKVGYTPSCCSKICIGITEVLDVQSLLRVENWCPDPLETSRKSTKIMCSRYSGSFQPSYNKILTTEYVEAWTHISTIKSIIFSSIDVHRDNLLKSKYQYVEILCYKIWLGNSEVYQSRVIKGPIF